MPVDKSEIAVTAGVRRRKSKLLPKYHIDQQDINLLQPDSKIGLSNRKVLTELIFKYSSVYEDFLVSVFCRCRSMLRRKGR